MPVRLSRTISRIGYAMITATDATTGVDTYGEIKHLPHVAGGREFAAEPNGENFSVYADGVEVYAEDENAGYNITLTTIDITDDVQADWYGNDVSSDGVAEFANKGQRPEFALFIYEDTTDGLGKITFFGKCHVTNRPNKNAKTKEEGTIDPQFPEHAISARPRWNDNFVVKEMKGNELLTAVPTITPASSPKAASYFTTDNED